ncbi:MAG: 1A family penicillin-binding protein [Parcubacteria group bacterium Gr01-1014_38]|nr:MAG: 1A family penicillin-binding protein [Parcubacteria group bacterium Gr01-1014_38]
MAHRRYTGGPPSSGLEAAHQGTAHPLRHFLRTHRRQLIRWGLFGSIGFFLFTSAAVVVVSRDLPKPGILTERAVKESTKIYDRTGTTLLYEIGEVHRTRVKFADISPHMIRATVATEDREFYQHRGVSFRGILRAVFRARPGRRLQGGSTITQQLAKNALLTPERTFTRKLREQLLALLIEQRYTKDQILELYLNEIPYGANAYGVEAAARAYFGASAKDLSPAQAALLAALPKAPTYYSPYGSHKDELFARQQGILNAMVDLKYLTPDEAETAKKTSFHFTTRREPIIAPHFVFYVRELLEQEYGETLVEQGGLKVTTTLDVNMQRAAEEAITQQAPKNLAYDARNAALTAMNPRNGDLLAMVGSVDYFDTENDGNVNVAIRPRSPGSSFKPIVYAEAFRKGFTPNTVLADVPIDFAAAGKSYSPKNFDLKYRGPVTIRQALAMSLNVPAVQALYLAGVNDAVALARQMGYTTLTDPERYGLSLVLGGGEVRLIDQVAGYSVFATEGIRYPQRAVLKVETPDGKVIFDTSKEEPKGEQVLESEIARLVTSILSDNAARAPMFGTRSPLQLSERPVAAKTGTAQEFRDGWTVGYTPGIVAGVWVGKNDNTPMKREPGVYTAAPIWNAFMRKVLQGTPIESFTLPPTIETGRRVLDGKLPEMAVRYELETGLALAASCGIEVGVPRRFIEFRSTLHYVHRESPRGDAPSNAAGDPQYLLWEKGVAAWREKDNAETPDDDKHYVEKLPDEQCDPSLFEGRPVITFRSPTDAVVKSTPIAIAVEVEAPARVTKVVFYAGDRKLAERSEPPWETSYGFGGEVRGDIVFRVRAETEAGKSNEVRRTIRVNPDSTLPRVELLAPKDRETLPPSAFPYTTRVKASDPSGIAAVDVFYTLPGDSRRLIVGRTTSPLPGRPDRFSIAWEAAPAPGTYELRARATDRTGNAVDTSSLSIVIP